MLKPLRIELVVVRAGSRPSNEDWYVYAGGQKYGYLYHSVRGYAAGIGKPGQEIRQSCTLPTKDAALQYAEQRIRAILDEERGE